MTCRWLLDAGCRSPERPSNFISLASLASLGTHFPHRPIESCKPSRQKRYSAKVNPERDARIHDFSKRLELELIPQDRVCPVRYGRSTQ